MTELIEYEKRTTAITTAITAFNLPAAPDGAIATTEKYIGIFEKDNVIKSQNANSENQYPLGSEATILLRSEIVGKILNMLAGGTFVATNYLKFGTGGKLVVETDPVVKTVNTVAIAMTAGSLDNLSEVLML